MVHQEGGLERGFSLQQLFLFPGLSSVEPLEADLSSRFSRNIKLRLPLVSSPMDTVTEHRMAIALASHGGVGVIHRNMSIDEQVENVRRVKAATVADGEASVDEEGRLIVAAAIGPFDVERARKLKQAGVDALVIDCAHAHNQKVIKSTIAIRREVSCDLVIGNIATGQAAEDCLEASPDGFRVGVGSGSICITRDVTGVWVPQATAIMLVAKVARQHGVPLISDGGVRSYGDVLKALALGADSVMSGYLFAGTLEAPGRVITRGGRRVKLYRGMGSRSVIGKTDRYMRSSKSTPEGIETYVEYRGSVARVIKEIEGALKQGMGYVGARDLEELRKRAVFGYI